MLSIWDKTLEGELRRLWISKKRVELIVAIPCYLRSSEAQAVLNAFEKKEGVLIRLPDIRSRDGTVSAPFSYEVFLSSSDRGVLRLLAHYTGQGSNFEDFLVGGEQEVGSQLREAASRHPIRFLRLLSTYWAEISEGFCDDIMDGTATYLNHRYGNLKTNDPWTPIDEPDASVLASHNFDELERHSNHWH